LTTRALFAALLWIFLASASHAAEPAATQPNPDHPGAGLYLSLCSRCHGVAADGNGADGRQMDPRPPDLTHLAARDPALLRLEGLVRVIDGRRTIRAHGTGQMPVWGWELVANEPNAQLREQARIRLVQTLAEYLLSIQQTAPAPTPDGAAPVR
jgi:mono/diheme cytochrome c family protein